MPFSSRVLLCCIVLIGAGVFAQELPPIRNFSPREYQGENQNWAISQGRDQRIYVANNKGLLQYDGSRWKVYPSPNESILRSVRVIGERIYTGCYMEFGFWEENPAGGLEYTSLSDQLNIEMLPDEEFWTILSLEGNLIFQSLDRIYIYHPEEEAVRWVDSETRITRVFEAGGALYFQRLQEGLYSLVNGQETLISDHPALRSDELVHISPTSSGLRLLTRHRGFFDMEGGSIAAWNTEVNGLLAETSVYSAIRLQNGGYMLGTIAKGLLHLDSKGRLPRSIDQLNGLGNNTILSLFEDGDNNIWVALDNGISILDLTSPYRYFYDKEGTLGSTYASAFHKGYTYLGTNQGLFFKKTGSAGEFRLIEGTRGQVWSLKTVGETLFCNHHTGTFEVSGEQIRKIGGTNGSWVLREVPGDSTRLLVGGYEGLQILERSNGSWKVRNRIAGFKNSARFVEWYKGSLFVNHEYKGVFRLEVDRALERVTKVSVDTSLKGADSGIALFEGVLWYANREGVSRYDDASASFQKDSAVSRHFMEDPYLSGRMEADDQNGQLWFFTKAGIQRISRASLSGAFRFGRIPLSQDARDGIAGYENFSPTPQKDRYLFGNRSGYMTVDVGRQPAPQFELRFSEIRLQSKGGRGQDSLLTLSGDVTLKHDHNSLEFLFYTSQYDLVPEPYYQYRLTGMYPEWSTWRQEPSVRFENLPSGPYTLEVRSRIGDTPSRNVAFYSFRISRPWYLSSGMIFLYILALCISGLMIHLSYRKYYKTRQGKLLEANQKELELERARSEKEIVQLKNEQLRKQFRDKSNELAASTMSIIKKNEILSRVKHRLLESPAATSEVKGIVEIIDQSLRGNDDWEMFKEAFNNADREFLDKLKSEHSNLSPNDIKLCAYLRLNLTSKEIAPLFNISVRSVEIKRYRLRKKMNLDRDENLVNYLLTL